MKLLLSGTLALLKAAYIAFFLTHLLLGSAGAAEMVGWARVRIPIENPSGQAPFAYGTSVNIGQWEHGNTWYFVSVGHNWRNHTDEGHVLLREKWFPIDRLVLSEKQDIDLAFFTVKTDLDLRYSSLRNGPPRVTEYCYWTGYRSRGAANVGQTPGVHWPGLMFMSHFDRPPLRGDSGGGVWSYKTRQLVGLIDCNAVGDPPQPALGFVPSDVICEFLTNEVGLKGGEPLREYHVTEATKERDHQVLYFTADWCKICKEMSPDIEEVMGGWDGWREVDVDEERDLADKYGISDLPAFVVLQDGEEKSRTVGKLNKHSLFVLRHPVGETGLQLGMGFDVACGSPCPSTCGPGCRCGCQRPSTRPVPNPPTSTPPATVIGERGQRGLKGDPGEKGDTGRGIDDMRITDGVLEVLYTDAAEWSRIGEIPCPDEAEIDYERLAVLLLDYISEDERFQQKPFTAIYEAGDEADEPERRVVVTPGGELRLPATAFQIRYFDVEGNQIGDPQLDTAPLGQPLRVKFKDIVIEDETDAGD